MRQGYVDALDDVLSALEASRYCCYCGADDCVPKICAECLDYVDKAIVKMVKAMKEGEEE